MNVNQIYNQVYEHKSIMNTINRYLKKQNNQDKDFAEMHTPIYTVLKRKHITIRYKRRKLNSRGTEPKRSTRKSCD